MTPGLPEILELALYRLVQGWQPEWLNYTPAQPAMQVQILAHRGPLISSFLDIARPHFATSNARVDLPKRMLWEGTPRGRESQNKPVSQMLTGSAEAITDARGPVPCKGTV